MVPAVSVKDVVVVFSDLELIKRDQEKIKVRTILTNRNNQQDIPDGMVWAEDLLSS